MNSTATIQINAATWFELPVEDLERAARFYETILETSMPIRSFAGREIAVFAHADEGVGGCLAAGVPTTAGTLVYLNATGRLAATLARVDAAGGRITMKPVALPHDQGYVAEIVDSEGNRVGLHANA